MKFTFNRVVRPFLLVRQPVYLIPWLFLIVTLGAVFFLWYQQEQLLNTNASVRFTNEVNDTKTAIRNRMLAYEDALRGLRGLFSTGDAIEQDEFKRYTDT